ncbi:ribonuclease H-like domain-containing protein [Tanacetum coccineum]
MILSPSFDEEHIAFKRDKAEQILLQSLPEDHMVDFHHLDDARDIWLAVKARFGGLEQFQKILSQLNQMQAKPDNEDCNMKFLRALPPSWLQVAITLKTKGGLDYLSFDDMYNKLRTLEIDVTGGSSYDSRGKQLDSKARYFAFKLKELDKSEEPKALLSVDSMLNWSDHEGEDVEKGVAQVYGMIAGCEDEDVAAGIATGDVAVNVSGDVSDAAAEFALMGFSSQVHTCPFGCEHKYAELKKEFDNVEAQYKECYIQVQAYKSTLQTLEQQKGWYQSNQLALEERIRILTANLENTTNMLKYTEKLNEQAKLEKMNDKVQLEETKARFDKWKDSSKNLDKLIHSSMSSRSKFGLGFGETFGSDEVFDPSGPSIFDTTPEDVAEKPLYDRFVKAVGMHVVPPPITGTFMPPSNNPDLDDTQFTYGSKSNNYFETNSVSNDFVSCDNSDKSSDSETTDFASCVSSVKTSSSKTNEPLASAPSSVEFKPVSKTDVQQSNSTNDDSSFSFKENVKPPRNLCNKSGINSRSLCKRKFYGSKTCFVCGSKFHLIKDCDFYEKQLELHNKPMWTNVANIPSFVPKAASVPAGSRNRPTSVPAGSRNRPTSVPAGRTFSAGWKKHAARTMTRPTSHYFQHFHRPGYYNQLYMDEGRWGTAVKPSAGCSWRIQRPNMQWGSKNNGGSHQSTWNKSSKNKRFRIVGGTVTFGGGDGKITRKGTIRTSKLNFENVYYVEELQNFNLFSVSQICDTKNKVLFTDKECLDETYGILKDFITFIENQLTKKVKAIRCDNGTEFKNSNLIELCGSKGIRRDYSNARTPQQNGVAERKNRTLIEAARTMLADSKLPTMFWTEAVSTACYVLNRVLVTKPHNKTPYELVSGKVPQIRSSFLNFCVIVPSCPYLHPCDTPVGKFEGKVMKAFNWFGYAAHLGLGHEWYFDLDYLTDSLEDSDSKYDEQVILVPSFPSNSFSGPKDNEASEVVESSSDYAEELARLQKQARNRVPAGKVDSVAGVTDGPTESSAPVFTPVHIDATSLPPGHSLGSSEHSTRYPSPSVGSMYSNMLNL